MYNFCVRRLCKDSDCSAADVAALPAARVVHVAGSLTMRDLWQFERAAESIARNATALSHVSSASAATAALAVAEAAMAGGGGGRGGFAHALAAAVRDARANTVLVVDSGGLWPIYGSLLTATWLRRVRYVSSQSFVAKFFSSVHCNVI